MKTLLLLTGLFIAVSAVPAFCADKTMSSHKKAIMNMTPAQREEMAATHEKMAACLRSDKPMMDCHKEMMESCKMGKNACPMMEMGHMHGMMGKGMKHAEMEDEGSDKEESK